ncbi:MAG: LURP-one-related family protein [Planctomycetes bacterium]|nr:LURP-one-related family protein [Planctomycetota bacterium]
MRQNLLAFGDDYVIRDELDRERYFVDGRAFSLGAKLSFQDMQGHELAFIRQRLLAWGPTFEITRGSEVLATVRKTLFTFFHCEFTVDVPGPDDLVADGDFFEHEYEFRRHGTLVARVSKQWFAFRDSYGIEVSDGEDDVLLLASAVVIDQCCHEKKG